jgi:predicted nucleic acid-binding protein
LIYFDTAYLAKCYLTDHGFEAVRDVATRDRVASCALARVEMAATFHRAFREERIPAVVYERIRRQFAADEEAGMWIWLAVTPALLRQAALCFERLGRAVFLRAADAIHLTCAAEHGFTEIYSNDRHLLAAAPRFGIKGRNVIQPRA